MLVESLAALAAAGIAAWWWWRRPRWPEGHHDVLPALPSHGLRTVKALDEEGWSHLLAVEPDIRARLCPTCGSMLVGEQVSEVTATPRGTEERVQATATCPVCGTTWRTPLRPPRREP